nr:AIPR family protein [uncultured Sphaerochaeta sp.]
MTIEKKVLEYRIDLIQKVKVNVLDSGEGPSLQFVKTVIADLSESSMISDPQLFYWKGVSSKRGVILFYGYDFDETDQSLTLFASDYQDSIEPHILTGSDIERLAMQAFRFFEESTTKTHSSFITGTLELQAMDTYDLIKEKLTSELGINKVKVLVLSSGFISTRVNRIPMHEISSGIESETIVWDMQWIYDNIYSRNEIDGVDIAIAEYPEICGSGIPCLSIPQKENDKYECYMAVVPGKLLSSVYRKYGSQLLEGNVRSFLTTKTSVNKKIQGTINSKPEKFFIFNNGIAVTADHVEVQVIAGEKRIMKILGMQVINGGQTTASLAYAEQKSKADLSDISVPMKLTVIHAEPTDYMSDIQQISESSNSQNKVTDADFFSNHEFHLIMENISRKLTVPPEPGIPYSTYWFYERMKGQYLQSTMFLTDADRRKYYDRRPKSQLITKTDLAKFHNIYIGKPQIVSKGASTNFNDFAKQVQKDWQVETRKAKYNDLYYQKMAVVGHLYRLIEVELQPKKHDWAGSYRANVISYTLSSFFDLVAKQYPLHTINFEEIWNANGISSGLMNTLIELAHLVYLTITNDTRTVENVTQWCKRDACLFAVKEAVVRFSISAAVIDPYLINKMDAKAIESDAAGITKISNEVDVYNKVLAEPYKSSWLSLYQFVDSKNNLFHLDTKKQSALRMMLKVASGKMSNIRLEHCTLALQIFDDAIAYGWKPKV